MRIGINALFLIPGEVGGSQTYFRETLLAMRRLFPSDDLVVFTQTECDPFARSLLDGMDRVSFVKLDFKASNRYARIIREQTELPLRAARAALDVLWSPGYTAPLAYSGAQAVSLLDMQYRRFPEDLSPLARWTTAALVGGGVRRCDTILTLSEFSKSEIIHFTRADAARIVVTLAGVDPRFDPTVAGTVTPENAASMAALEGHPFVFCVANTYPHKNIHTLIESFALMPPRLPHRLLLVGKPRLGEPRVKAALDALPEAVRRRIVRVDAVTFDELVTLYRSCALFVFPTLYEGFGLPVLEAMLAGAPVLASDIPVMREVGGEWVEYARANDAREWAAAMERGLECGASARNRLIAGARLRARAFTWDETARTTHAALRAAATAR